MQCPVCLFSYAADFAKDRAQHRKLHDAHLNGVPARALSSEIVISTDGVDRITLVTDASPLALRKRAEEISMMANREMHFDQAAYRAIDPPDERRVHLFLFHRGDRLLGLAALERRVQSWRGTWAEFDALVDRAKVAPDVVGPLIWSLGFIWLHKNVRGTGRASALLRAACSYLNIDAAWFGWYVPFEDAGLELARRFSPNGLAIV